MGDWTIVISGCGQNQNGKEQDADEMGKSFVQALKQAGQNVRLSTFTNGIMFQLVPPQESTLCNPGELMRAYSNSDED